MINTLHSGDLTLELTTTSGGIQVTGLLDGTTELLSSSNLPIFKITVRNESTTGFVTQDSDSGWGTVGVVENGDGLYTLSWSDPDNAQIAGLAATVTIQTEPANNALLWDISVTNTNEVRHLWQVDFPQVSIKDLGSGSKVLVPAHAGVETVDMWGTPQIQGGNYPTGNVWGQYMAAYNNNVGVYIANQDTFGSTKDIIAQSKASPDRVEFRFEVPVPNMSVEGTNYVLEGNARWQLTSGSYHDASLIYREFAKTAEWWPDLGEDGRSDTPLWARKNSCWIKGGGDRNDPENIIISLQTFKSELNLPYVFMWFSWHVVPQDNDFPHFIPAVDGYASAVAVLEPQDITVSPYTNLRVFDTRDRGLNDVDYTPDGLPYATKDINGDPYEETYDSKETDESDVVFSAECPFTSGWQTQMVDLINDMFTDFDNSAVYCDQVGFARPRLCFDATHNHPLGGGHHWTSGYRTMLGSIDEVVGEDEILTTEGNAEPYIKSFDACLTLEWMIDNMVPAFLVVYGGVIQTYGRTYNVAASSVAHQMMTGQSLVWGQQIGWFEPPFTRIAESGPYILDCIHLRWNISNYFYAGTMIRPARMEGANTDVTADWIGDGEDTVTTESVLTASWQKGDEVVIVITNVSNSPVILDVNFDPSEYGFSQEPITATIVNEDGSQGTFDISGGSVTDMTFEARSVVAWILSPATSTDDFVGSSSVIDADGGFLVK